MSMNVFLLASIVFVSKIIHGEISDAVRARDSESVEILGVVTKNRL